MNDKELEQALRRDAQRIDPAVPAGMERRISEAVARSRAELEPAGRMRWRPLALGLALAGMAAAAALVFELRPDHPAGSGLTPAEAAEAAQLAAEVKVMPGRVWAAVQPQAEAALAANPLLPDTAALQEDARSALGFLADNFLPEPAPGQNRG